MLMLFFLTDCRCVRIKVLIGIACWVMLISNFTHIDIVYADLFLADILFLKTKTFIIKIACFTLISDWRLWFKWKLEVVFIFCHLATTVLVLISFLICNMVRLLAHIHIILWQFPWMFTCYAFSKIFNFTHSIFFCSFNHTLINVSEVNYPLIFFYCWRLVRCKSYLPINNKVIVIDSCLQIL